jgi:hypothetical protein
MQLAAAAATSTSVTKLRKFCYLAIIKKYGFLYIFGKNYKKHSFYTFREKITHENNFPYAVMNMNIG